MTACLVLRRLPFQAGQNLILAEAAALVAWATENHLDADPATWILADRERRELEVGIGLPAPPTDLPSGLRVVSAPTGSGELHDLCFDSFRTGPARWFRIDHDPERGHPIAATAHDPSSTAHT